MMQWLATLTMLQHLYYLMLNLAVSQMALQIIGSTQHDNSILWGVQRDRLLRHEMHAKHSSTVSKPNFARHIGSDTSPSQAP